MVLIVVLSALYAVATTTAFAESVVPELAKVIEEHNDNIEVDEIIDEPGGCIYC